MIIRRLVFILIILFFAFPLGSYGADGKIGIVLLHGKQDRAPYKIASLANRLKDEGYLVAPRKCPGRAAACMMRPTKKRCSK